MSIVFRDVSYSYAEGTAYRTDALNQISLNIGDGEFVGIMGQTGSGKSTLIQLAAGLLTPSSGQVLLNGEDINERSYDRRRLRKAVGIVFQFPEAQLFESTVEKDVGFGPSNLGWDKERIQTAVQESLALMGFDYEVVKDQSPLGFSGGEKRRLAIAGVLASDPDFLILDEPVAGLDPSARRNLLTLLRDLNQAGKTILMVSHNVDALSECAGRIILMDRGSVVFDGESAEAFSDPDFLKEHGIRGGQVSRLVQMLREKGSGLSNRVIRYDELLDALAGSQQ